MTSTESPFQPEIDDFYDRYFPGRRDEARSTFETTDTEAEGADEDEQYTDEEAVRLATTGLWGREFALLHGGKPLEVTNSDGRPKYLDTDGKPDESRVEFNYCYILARYGIPKGQIQRIYENSELANVLKDSRPEDKWNTHSWRGANERLILYKDKTVAKAISLAEREGARKTKRRRKK